MPAILRKSFTACEQFAALPPTPRKKSRRRARAASASSAATRLDRRRVEAATTRAVFVEMLLCVAHGIGRPLPPDRPASPRALRRSDFVEPSGTSKPPRSSAGSSRW
jgi:hypothetical protein